MKKFCDAEHSGDFRFYLCDCRFSRSAMQPSAVIAHPINAGMPKNWRDLMIEA
jgi:hypothetical protein